MINQIMDTVGPCPTDELMVDAMMTALQKPGVVEALKEALNTEIMNLAVSFLTPKPTILTVEQVRATKRNREILEAEEQSTPRGYKNPFEAMGFPKEEAERLNTEAAELIRLRRDYINDKSIELLLLNVPLDAVLQKQKLDEKLLEVKALASLKEHADELRAAAAQASDYEIDVSPDCPQCEYVPEKLVSYRCAVANDDRDKLMVRYVLAQDSDEVNTYMFSSSYGDDEEPTGQHTTSIMLTINQTQQLVRKLSEHLRAHDTRKLK